MQSPEAILFKLELQLLPVLHPTSKPGTPIFTNATKENIRAERVLSDVQLVFFSSKRPFARSFTTRVLLQWIDMQIFGCPTCLGAHGLELGSFACGKISSSEPLAENEGLATGLLEYGRTSEAGYVLKFLGVRGMG